MDGTLAKSLAEDFFKNGLQKCVDTRAHTHALWCDVVGWCVCTQTCICTLYIVHVQYITFFFRYSQSHLGRHFRKLKAQSSNVSFSTFQWKETFELWALSFETAFENMTASGIGCTLQYIILHVQYITFFIIVHYMIHSSCTVHYILYSSCTTYYIFCYCRHTGTLHNLLFMYNILHYLLL